MFTQDRIHWRPLGRWAGLLLAGGLSAMMLMCSLAGAAIAGRLAAHYPDTRPLPGLSGLRLTVMGLGQCLVLDQHLLARATLAAVERWYAAHGWDPFVPLKPRWRLGRLAFGRLVYLEPASAGATRVLQRQAFCLDV